MANLKARISNVSKRITAGWHWLPVIVRAPVIAFVVLNIGSTAGVLPLLGNMRAVPGVPWALPATILVMAMFWYYFTGGGYPASTRAMRQEMTRRRSLPWRLWRAAILPVVFSVATVTSLRLLLPSLLPIQAPKVAVDLSPFPVATVLGMLLSIALSAGIVEEVAFRGYLQKPLEERFGIVPALIVTGIAFWLAHADKVSITHLPFHLVASVLLGLSAYLTRSLVPAIIGHAVGDALLLPAYAFRKPAIVWSALAARPVWEGSGAVGVGDKVERIWQAMQPGALAQGPTAAPFAFVAWIFVLSALLSYVAFMRLARVARAEAGATSKADVSAD